MFFNKKKKSQSMPVSQTRAPSVDPSFIGRNTFFEGQINCEGELHIDGQVRGHVRAALCVIDRNGMVVGNVASDVIHVRGRITGPVQGGAIYVYAGGHIEGDVFHDSISIEPGGNVDGNLRRNQARNAVTSGPKLEEVNLRPALKGLRVVGSDK